MNQKQAKRLRKIARDLHLNPSRVFAPVGPVRYYAARVVDVDVDGTEIFAPRRERPRPWGLGECERRAYQEAKKLYHQPVAEVAPDSREVRRELEQKPTRHFRDRMVDSIKRQPDGPVEL